MTYLICINSIIEIGRVRDFFLDFNLPEIINIFAFFQNKRSVIYSRKVFLAYLLKKKLLKIKNSIDE